MNVAVLFVTETTIPPSSDQASWWGYGLGSIYVLGSLAAIAAALIALAGFKPTLREWREALVARMFAWRWASPRRHLLLRKVGHWLVPRDWRMTEEGKRAWDDKFDAAVTEYARRDDARQRHRETKRKRRVLRRKRCVDCGERCDVMGTLFEDGSAVCGECGLQRRAAETGTRWESYEHDRGVGFRRVPLKPTPSDTGPDSASEETGSTA